MPRHPRIALTSRLRVHTTNDNAGSDLRSDTKLGRAACMVQLVRMIYLSLDLDVRSERSNSIASSGVRHRFAAHAENRSRHGIDLKNPFTMSKSSQSKTAILLIKSRSRLLHHSDIGERVPPAAPSVAAKLRLVAPLRFAGRPGLRAN